MAASTSPLVWDFFRELGSSVGVKTGGVAHYYDETAQTIFLNGGLKTRLSAPASGQWKTAELSAPSQFVNTLDYIKLDLDHPANGTLYMAAVKADGTLQFLRYQYAADISQITAQVTFTSQVDNPITQISASVNNVSNEFFSSNGTLFNPGAKLTLGVAFGGSEVYPIGVAYLDETQHDPLAQSVPISGRNAIGYFLKEASFGTQTHFVGTYNEIGTALAALAGVPKFRTQVGTGTVTIDYAPKDSVLKGFDYLNNVVYHNFNNPMQLAELPDGTVINGHSTFVAQYLPNGYYTFEVGREVFKRKTKKSADGAYSGIYVTGKTIDGKALAPVELPVENYKYWKVPAKKLLHISAPEGWVATQPDLQWFAEQEVKKLRFIGIGEDFTSPLRPQLLVGDVAEIAQDGVGVTLGIVTEVKHTLGAKGFRTDFSVDSGGEIITTQGSTRTNVSGQNGHNRKQRITDIIKIVAGK